MSAYDINLDDPRDVDPDYPIARISRAIAHLGSDSRADLERSVTPEEMLGLLAYCDEHGVRFQGVVDRAANRGFSIGEMMQDAIATAAENEIRANAADIERKFRLAPWRNDIAAIMQIWRDEHRPDSYAQQRYFGIQGAAVLRALEESLLAGGGLPRWYLERKAKEQG